MGKPPELNFARLDRDDRIDLAVNGNDLALREFDMLDEQKPFRYALQNRKKPFQAIDHKAARHPAQDLLGNKAMSMRMIPEQSRALAPVGWNIHLVFEVLARMNMDEDIIAIPFRRDSHAMKMQITWVIGQMVPERNAQEVARARSE